MNWLRAHQFKVHTIAFLMMVLPPVPLYYAAINGNALAMYLLLGIVILGNILVLFVR
jgi:hypothetical protein